MEAEPGIRRRLVFVLILVVLAIVGLELSARIYAAITAGAPLLHPEEALYETWYRELRHPRSREIRSDDRHFDVLVLGGSVLYDRYAPFEAALREELSFLSRREVKVYSLAKAAQTTRDSLLKYRELGAQRFDVIIVYHGINDLRADQIPETDYRDDYSHMDWYRRVNWLSENQDRLRWSAIPYVLRDIRVVFEKLTGRYRPAVEGAVDLELGYHDVHKTKDAFRSNLEGILSLARERGDRVLLMTYAWHIPDDYTYKGFKRKQIDYATHRVAVEGWGSAESVATGLRAHNEVVRELAAEHPEALFVDQEALIPGEGLYWNDVCHLTVRGTALFAGNAADAIQSAGLLKEDRQAGAAPNR
jgi:hypothetical protein